MQFLIPKQEACLRPLFSNSFTLKVELTADEMHQPFERKVLEVPEPAPTAHRMNLIRLCCPMDLADRREQLLFLG